MWVSGPTLAKEGMQVRPLGPPEWELAPRGLGRADLGKKGSMQPLNYPPHSLSICALGLPPAWQGFWGLCTFCPFSPAGPASLLSSK